MLIYVYIYLQNNIHINAYICKYMQVYIFTCNWGMHIYIHTQSYIYIYMYIYTYIYIYIYIYTYIYIWGVKGAVVYAGIRLWGWRWCPCGLAFILRSCRFPYVYVSGVWVEGVVGMCVSLSLPVDVSVTCVSSTACRKRISSFVILCTHRTRLYLLFVDEDG